MPVFNGQYLIIPILKDTPLFRLKAINFQQGMKQFKPKINEKDGTIGTSSFQDTLLLRIGAKLMIIHNIDTLDSLTNGQMGHRWARWR